jgi:predicted molibdopterin-dependent oxidoreductase YjgC
MSEILTVRVNGALVEVPAGSTVAVAVMLSIGACRRSVTGQPRAPLCGMGTCFECRVEINGQTHQRSCQVICEANMEINAYG